MVEVMPTNCCLCDSVNDKDRVLSFHAFPQSKVLRRKWSKFSSSVRKWDGPYKTSRICSLHFTEDDFVNATQVKMGLSKLYVLKKSAIPSIKAQMQPVADDDSSSSKQQRLQKHTLAQIIMDELVPADKTINDQSFAKQSCIEDCKGLCSDDLKDHENSCEVFNATSDSGLISLKKDDDNNELKDLEECSSSIENFTYSSGSQIKTTCSEGSDNAQRTILKNNLSISNIDNFEHLPKDNKGEKHPGMEKKTHAQTVIMSKTLHPRVRDSPESDATKDYQCQHEFSNLIAGTSGSLVQLPEKCKHFSKQHSSDQIDDNDSFDTENCDLKNNVKSDDENCMGTIGTTKLIDPSSNSTDNVNSTSQNYITLKDENNEIESPLDTGKLLNLPSNSSNVKLVDEGMLDSAKATVLPSKTSINASVVPVSHPVGPTKRKQSGETFHVKSVQPNESSTSCNSSKAKIRPIFGNVKVTSMLKENGPFPIIFIGTPNISDMRAYVKETNSEASKTISKTSQCNSSPGNFDSDNSKILNGEELMSDAMTKGDCEDSDKAKDHHSDTKKDNTQPYIAPSSENQGVIVASNNLKKQQQRSDLDSSYAKTVSRDSEYDLKKAMDGFFKGQEDENDSAQKCIKAKPSNVRFASLDDIALNARPTMVIPNSNIIPHPLINNMGGRYAAPYNIFSDLPYKPWVSNNINGPKPVLPWGNNNINAPKPIRFLNHVHQFNKPPPNVTSDSFTKRVYVVPFTSKPQNFSRFNGKHTVIKTKPTPHFVPKSNTIISTVKVSNPSSGNVFSMSSVKPSNEPLPKKAIIGTTKSAAYAKLISSTITPIISHQSLANSFQKAVKRKVESANHQDSSQNEAKKMHLDLNSQSSKAPIHIRETSPSKCYLDQSNTDCSIPTNPKKPGVLVKFEDGVRLWIDRLRDLMYLDDEPVNAWKLTPGTEVAAKYTDGLFYDAIVQSTCDGRTFEHLKEKKVDKPVRKDEATTVPPNCSFNLKVPRITSKSTETLSSESPPKRKQVGRPSFLKNKNKSQATPEIIGKINSTKSPQVRIEKLELHKIPETTSSRRLRKDKQPPANSPAPSDDLPDSGNPMLRIKCPHCFLVFKNVSLFRMHQKTVCGSNGVPVTGFHFEPDVTVKVDEKGVPPFVTSQPKPNNGEKDQMKLIPRAPDGRRCFRRGTHILHRWQTDKGSRWFNGKILRLLESNKGSRCEFEVEYTDDDHDSGPYAVCLYEDYPHDIRIVTR